MNKSSRYPAKNALTKKHFFFILLDDQKQNRSGVLLKVRQIRDKFSALPLFDKFRRKSATHVRQKYDKHANTFGQIEKQPDY